MTLIQIPFAFNIMIGVGIRLSNSPTSLKRIFTDMVVVKFLIFFISAIQSDVEILMKIGVVICAALNVALIIIGYINSITMMTIGSFILLLLLIIWSCVAVFDIRIKGGKKR